MANLELFWLQILKIFQKKRETNYYLSFLTNKINKSPQTYFLIQLPVASAKTVAFWSPTAISSLYSFLSFT